MASKSVYQDLDQTVLQHFGLDSAPVYGVLSSSNLDTVDPVLCVQDPDKYQYIKDKLLSETTFSWKTLKRAFVLPKCPVSLDRIKVVAKEHDIVIVGDYEKADFIISHGDFYEPLNNSETIKSTLLLAKLWNYDVIDNTSGRIPAVDNSNFECIYDDKWAKKVNSWNCNTTNLYDSWMITGMALNIAYALETGTLQGVINVDTLMHSATSTSELTEDLLETVGNMISSYSDDDTEIVAKILPTIDNGKNHHLLWALMKKIDNNLYKFNRNKDVQFWVNNLKYKYSRLDAQGMILQLEKDEILDTKSFKYLEPICRKEITIYNRDLYVFNVSVKPKYQQYLK